MQPCPMQESWGGHLPLFSYEATDGAKMISQDTHFLRVGFLSLISKVVVDQVAIQMLCRNAIEAVN